MRNAIIRALAGCLLAGTAAAQDMGTAQEIQQRAQEAAVAAQAQVEALDDAARRLLDEYRRLEAERARLARYHDQVARLVRRQEEEILALTGQLEELAVTRREILPLMQRMVEALEAVVAADQPFLPEERRARVAALKRLLDDPEATLPAQFRRILEAYQVEAGYGRTLEVRERAIEVDGAARTVEVLRVGRLALFYRSLDGRRVGRWDPQARRWVALDGRYAAPLAAAFAVARKQSAPALLTLPLPTPGEGR